MTARRSPYFVIECMRCGQPREKHQALPEWGYCDACDDIMYEDGMKSSGWGDKKFRDEFTNINYGRTLCNNYGCPYFVAPNKKECFLCLSKGNKLCKKCGLITEGTCNICKENEYKLKTLVTYTMSPCTSFNLHNYFIKRFKYDPKFNEHIAAYARIFLQTLQSEYAIFLFPKEQLNEIYNFQKNGIFEEKKQVFISDPIYEQFLNMTPDEISLIMIPKEYELFIRNLNALFN